MQLEMKVVIDFGDDGPADMDHAFRRINEDLNSVLAENCNFFGASATTNMGWTSSGDDEE